MQINENYIVNPRYVKAIEFIHSDFSKDFYLKYFLSDGTELVSDPSKDEHKIRSKFSEANAILNGD